jgi:hypothetical protein
VIFPISVLTLLPGIVLALYLGFAKRMRTRGLED